MGADVVALLGLMAVGALLELRRAEGSVRTPVALTGM
jgi:hypothetical protein